MAAAKVWVNGSWVDICSVFYYIYVDGQFEDLYSRPFTFYDEAGTGYQFLCQAVPQPATVTLSNKTNNSIEYSIDMPDYTNVDVLEFYLDGVKTGEIAPPTGNPVIRSETGLNSSTQYDFYVVSINTAGSAQSNTVTETTLSDAPVLSVQSADHENETVTLEWTNVNADSYNLYRDGVIHVSGISGATLSYQDTGLTDGQSYDYYVVGVIGGVEGAQSNTITHQEFAAPGVPQNVLASYDSGGDVILVSYDPPISGGPVDRYELDIKLLGNLFDNVPDFANIANPEPINQGDGYEDEGGPKTIQEDNEYCFQIRAVGPGGTSAWSTEDCEYYPISA